MVKKIAAFILTIGLTGNAFAVFPLNNLQDVALAWGISRDCAALAKDESTREDWGKASTGMSKMLRGMVSGQELKSAEKFGKDQVKAFYRKYGYDYDMCGMFATGAYDWQNPVLNKH